MYQSHEKFLFLSHSEKCNRSLKKKCNYNELHFSNRKVPIALFYENSATDAYFFRVTEK
jgi:hypothetical protein